MCVFRAEDIADGRHNRPSWHFRHGPSCQVASSRSPRRVDREPSSHEGTRGFPASLGRIEIARPFTDRASRLTRLIGVLLGHIGIEIGARRSASRPVIFGDHRDCITVSLYQTILAVHGGGWRATPDAVRIHPHPSSRPCNAYWRLMRVWCCRQSFGTGSRYAPMPWRLDDNKARYQGQDNGFDSIMPGLCD